MASLLQPGYSYASAELASRKSPPTSLLTRVPGMTSRPRAGGCGFSRGVSLGVHPRGGIGRFASRGFHLGLRSTGNTLHHVERALARVVVNLAP